jgi:AcrR family transcriptional regulator
MAHESQDDPGSPDGPGSWRERAVDRSLGSAREQALDRSNRFIAAATEALVETGRLDFTVQEVVERAGLSLRSFYKHFASKEELLLALFEELIAAFVANLRAEVEAEDDPLDRLRAYVTGFFSRAQRAQAGGGRALGIYHLRMADGRQDDFARAIEPQIVLLREIVDGGVAAGRFRQDISPATLTLLLTETMIFTAQMSVFEISLTGTQLAVEDLWAWCAQAVLPRPTG